MILGLNLNENMKRTFVRCLVLGIIRETYYNQNNLIFFTYGNYILQYLNIWLDLQENVTGRRASNWIFIHFIAPIRLYTHALLVHITICNGEQLSHSYITFHYTNIHHSRWWVNQISMYFLLNILLLHRKDCGETNDPWRKCDGILIPNLFLVSFTGVTTIVV